MIKSTLLFLALLFFLKIAQGQNLENRSKNQIEISFGYQSNVLKDANFSPLNQHGGGFATLLKYKRRSKNIFGANFQFSPGQFNSGPSNAFSSTYIHANLEIEYLFKLTQKTDTYHFFIGPAYNTNVLYLDWYNLDAFSYTATHGIDIKGLVSKRINKKQFIQATLSVPVFQFLARPPYNGIDENIIENQDNPAKIIFSGTPSSFNSFIALEFGVTYKYKLRQHLDWCLNYALFSQKVNAPNRFKSLSNTLSTGLVLNF